MTTETSTRQSKNFVTAMLPWLLGAGMFAAYLVTLNHWLSLTNLSNVVEISGWTRGASQLGPVLYLVTLPFRLLPVNAVPLALNIFTALCAALTLCQLARSVALLPHDRTYEQRQREQSEYSFLTIRMAWLPPVFAVLVCGLQMTFWENSVDATGEIFNLLIFAYAIRCLVEYRIQHQESWMLRFAIIYGLGMANNWAMVAFLPLFLAATIWIKGLSFFKPAFMLRTAACGLAGFSLFFLMPLINSLHHDLPVGFWSSIYTTVAGDKAMFMNFPRDVVMVLGLTSLLPMLVIGLRWASYFGDNSPLGIFMATSMFHIIHALFFLSCLWVMLDSPISPRVMGYGFAFLPFYYLSSLAIGYFSGYFLLIFGTSPSRSKMSLHPLLRLLNLVVTACVWLLVIAMPAILVRKNLPHIQSDRTLCRQLARYFAKIEQQLPATGAVVMCDDPAQPYPVRLAYLEATMRRAGKGSPHLLISAAGLTHDPTYLAYLQKRYPDWQLSPVGTNLIGGEPAAMDIIRLVDRLAKDHPVYYLHPSFGYFFEHFYAEQQGLLFRLKVYPSNVWDAPLPDARQIEATQAFWKQTFTNDLPPLMAALYPPALSKHPGYWEKLMLKLHLKPEPDKMAAPLGALYSRAIDNWGVELQRAGRIEEAAKAFDQAGSLNPYNISAGLNKGFNKKLAAGADVFVNPPKNLEEKLGQHRNWTEILTIDGPIDEPNCRFDLADILYHGGNYRQSVQHLDRIKELSPNSLQIPLQLAQVMIFIQKYPSALSGFFPYTQGYSLACSNADEVLRRIPDQPDALFLKSVALMQLEAYDQAIDPLSRLITVQSNNYKAHLDRAISYYKLGKFAQAKPDYQSVQTAIPSAYQASYGLAKIAEKENDAPAAIKNYELYLQTAPTNSAEANGVIARLKELKSAAPAP